MGGCDDVMGGCDDAMGGCDDVMGGCDDHRRTINESGSANFSVKCSFVSNTFHE